MFDPCEIERAIVLQLLRPERPARWARRELMRELRHLEPVEVSKAIVRLEEAGVIGRGGNELWAARATRRLDELGLIAV